VIQIRTQVVDSQRISIEISDNGIPINEDVKAQIFDPIFMSKTTGEGSGLGLALSYLIVLEQHKGELKCFSEPEQGNKFRIEIPRRHT